MGLTLDPCAFPSAESCTYSCEKKAAHNRAHYVWKLISIFMSYK